jgi:hypothetical protein
MSIGWANKKDGKGIWEKGKKRIKIKERTTEIILPVTSDTIILSLMVNNSRHENL